MSGWTDLPLSVPGRRQVDLLVARLRGEPAFAAIYASPLQRAADTARAISAAGLGHLRLCELLREINCGEVDGLPIEEVRRRYPSLWDANLRQEDADLRWPAGESYRELRRRSIEAVQHIAARHPSQRVAVVTHAGVISQVIGSLYGLSAARWEPFRPGNTSLTEVDWSGESGVLVAFNERSHLPPELSDPSAPAPVPR
jgi:alpha-ribazole phosphatase/probable phosphoglycerate mutase